MSGKVELYFEEDLVSYVSSDPVEDSIIGNKKYGISQTYCHLKKEKL
ncbi:MAG: hypothetical protein R2771_00645 [Saprospiraceae bacterium]